MVYIQHNELSVIEVRESENELSFDVLAKVMLDRPSNMIYCQLNGELHGIISMGDIARASERGCRCVKINRHYAKISQNDGYRAAQHIFNQKKNMNALPVTTKDNEFIGAYVRWDDFYDRKMFSMGETKLLCHNYKYIIFVRPCEMFGERYRVFEDFYEYMASWREKVKIEVISYCEIIKYIDEADLILFTSEDEVRAIETYVRDILHRDFPKRKVQIYRDWAREIKSEIKYEFVKQYLRDISSQGVHVLNLRFAGGAKYMAI